MSPPSSSIATMNPPDNFQNPPNVHTTINAELAFISFLQSEYLLLATECRRKLPDVKTVIEEQVFNELKRLKDSLTASSSSEVAVTQGGVDVQSVFVKMALRFDIFLDPLATATASKQTKLIGIVGNILQRLCVNYECLNLDKLNIVLEILEGMTATGTEELQLKTLQSIVPVVTGRLSQLPDGFLPKCLLLVFSLMLESKHSTIRNTALAVLRQLVIVLFESFSNIQPSFSEIANSKSTTDEIEKPEIKHAKEAQTLLHDICASYNDGYHDNKKAKNSTTKEEDTRYFYPKISRTVALELIESILANRGAFQQLPSLLSTIKDKLCTTLVKRLEVVEFAENARLWRICNCLLHQYFAELTVEGEIFISFAIRILDDTNAVVWKKVLAAEVLREVLLDHSLVLKFFSLGSGVDHPISVLDMLECLRRVIHADLQTPAKDNPMISFEGAMQLKVPCLAQFDKNVPPAIPANHLTLLAFQSIYGLLSNLFHPLVPSNLPTPEIRTALVKQIWPVILSSMERIFQANIDLSWRLEILRSFQTLFLLLCHLEVFKEGQQAVLDCLLGYLKNSTSLLNEAARLNVAKTLLSSVSTVTDLLTCSDWRVVFAVIHWVDAYTLSKSKRLTPLPRTASASTVSSTNLKKPCLIMEDTAFDLLADLTELTGLLIEGSVNLSDNTFLNQLQAALQVIPLEEKEDTTSNNNLISACLYALQKLRQLVIPNCQRFSEGKLAFSTLGDPLLHRYLGSANVEIRSQAMEILCMAAVKTLSKSDINDKVQADVLRALQQSVVIGQSDNILTLLETLAKLISSNGEHLSQAGWNPLLQLLLDFLANRSLKWFFQPNDDSEGNEILTTIGEEIQLSLLRAAFGILKLIGSDFLTSLNASSTKLYIECLRLTASLYYPLDLNIALTSIGLLWDVADNSLRKHENVSGEQWRGFELWQQGLRAFYELGQIQCTDVRNSSLTSLFRAVVDGGDALQNSSQWTWLYLQLIVPLMQGLFAGYERQFLSPNTKPPNHSHFPNNPNSNVVDEKEMVEKMSKTSLNDNFAKDSRKPWNETLIIALEGSQSVLQRHFSKLTTVLSEDIFLDTVWVLSLLEPCWLYITNCTFDYHHGSQNLSYQGQVVLSGLNELIESLQVVLDYCSVEKDSKISLINRLVVITFDLLKPLAGIVDSTSNDHCYYYEQAALIKILKVPELLLSLNNNLMKTILPTLDLLGFMTWYLSLINGALQAPFSIISQSMDERLNDVDNITDLQKVTLSFPNNTFLTSFEYNPDVKVLINLSWIQLILHFLNKVISNNNSPSLTGNDNIQKLHSGDKRPTLIAWSREVLQTFPLWFCPHGGDIILLAELYDYPVTQKNGEERESAYLLNYLWDVLSKWLQAKHQAPHSVKLEAPWKSTYRSFEQLLLSIDYSMLTLEHWTHLLEALIKALDSLPTTHELTEESDLKEEETMDQDFLTICLGQCILPNLHLFIEMDKEANLACDLIKSVEQVSRFVQYVPPPPHISRITVHSRLFPVAKEQVAQCALQLLIDCIQAQKGNNHNVIVQMMTARLALDTLLQRTSRLLQLYVKESRLPVEDIPLLQLPSICTDEVLYLLSQLEQVRLRSDLYHYTMSGDEQTNEAVKGHRLHLWLLFEDLIDVMALLGAGSSDLNNRKVAKKCRQLVRDLISDLGILRQMPRMTPAQSYGPPSLFPMCDVNECISQEQYERFLLYDYDSSRNLGIDGKFEF